MNAKIEDLLSRKGRAERELETVKSELRQALLEEAGIVVGQTIVESNGKLYRVFSATLESYNNTLRLKGEMKRKDGSFGAVRQIYSYEGWRVVQ